MPFRSISPLDHGLYIHVELQHIVGKNSVSHLHGLIEVGSHGQLLSLGEGIGPSLLEG